MEKIESQLNNDNNNNNKLNRVLQVWFNEGSMYVDIISTLNVERSFPMDPQLKER